MPSTPRVRRRIHGVGRALDDERHGARQPAHEDAPARRADLVGPVRLGEQQPQRVVAGPGDDDLLLRERAVRGERSGGSIVHVAWLRRPDVRGAEPLARALDQRAAELRERVAALLVADAVHEQHGGVIGLGCHTPKEARRRA